MKKLFGGIDLTWKKLILFAIIAAFYTALMAIIPFTKDTSFRDIAINLEWWILLGIIIVCNSKSPKDSALKCFVFFLISQPLIYLLQVPFSSAGWKIFGYYKYWFIWTLLTLPMGFIGYYIKKNNLLSVVILLPMIILLAYLGLGYFSETLNNFPYHLLSCISCFGLIIIIVLNIFDKLKLRIISLLITAIFIIIYVILKGGIANQEYETFRNLDEFNLNLVGKITVSSYYGTAKGDVKITNIDSDTYTVKIFGIKGNKYKFSIKDDSGNEYNFQYYFSKKENTVILKKVENNE